MAGDFIKIDVGMNGAFVAPDVLGFVQSLRALLSSGRMLKARLGHMHDGVDFTVLEAQCGLQAGQGQIIFDYINGTIGALEGTFQTADGKVFSERVG